MALTSGNPDNIRNEGRHDDRRSVYIPVVPRSAGNSSERSQSESSTELVKIYAQTIVSSKRQEQSENKALDKDWPLVAAPLRQTGSALFQAGCAAISAVRTLSIQRPKFAVHQYFRPQAWLESLRLYAAGHRGPSEGGSAQLGLAIVLLMAATHSKTRNIIATGVLSTRSSREYDSRVCPVGNLPQKLKLVLEHAKSKSLALPDAGKNQPLIFFTPKTYEVDDIIYQVVDLPDVKYLQDAGIKVEPIEWLSEAAELLDAKSTRYHVVDHIYHSVFAFVTTAVFVVLAGLSWLAADIPMVFVSSDSNNRSAEPFVSCFTGYGSYVALALQKTGLTPSLPATATLGWKIRSGDNDSLNAKISNLFGYSGYYIAMVMLAQHSSAKIVIPKNQSSNKAQRFKPGEIMEWGWKLNSQVESNRLVILSQRYSPFDANTLRNDLISKFPMASGSKKDTRGLDITAASNFLVSQSTGFLTFQFLTTNNKVMCPVSDAI